MVAATERGLLLTTLWYIREVDPQTLLLTGLTRDGVFLVEGGEVTGAVNNFRFNESPVDLLGRHGAGRPDRAHAAAGVERLVHPRRDAAAAGARLQHEQRQPGQLDPRRHTIGPSSHPFPRGRCSSDNRLADAWEELTATTRADAITARYREKRVAIPRKWAISGPGIQIHLIPADISFSSHFIACTGSRSSRAGLVEGRTP